MSHFGLSRRISAPVAAFVIVSIAVAGLSYAFETSSSELRKLLTQSNRVSQTLFALIEAVGKVQGISQKVVREKDPDVMEKLIAEQKSLVSLAETGIGEAQAQNTDVSRNIMPWFEPMGRRRRQYCGPSMRRLSRC